MLSQHEELPRSLSVPFGLLSDCLLILCRYSALPPSLLHFITHPPSRFKDPAQKNWRLQGALTPFTPHTRAFKGPTEAERSLTSASDLSGLRLQRESGKMKEKRSTMPGSVIFYGL